MDAGAVVCVLLDVASAALLAWAVYVAITSYRD